ncbi:hypothetical protein FSP39_017516 [Pinctada imbricata]|uniref:Transmembrane protein 26 n=1 Tax=Pinctada imbricata TaxID=66713 RepID=A0AA89BUC6_PINIB|nr:hypothetical protein FSP39_017516 [Pinctada imbricata]
MDSGCDVREFVCQCKPFPVSIVQAVFVRILFFIHSILALTRVVTLTGEPMYWIYCLMYLPFLAESTFIIVKRKGVEFRWVYTSLLMFIIMDLPPIWLLETNRTKERRVKIVGDLTLSIDNDSFVYAVEQTFLLIMILARWILPRGSLSREKLSNLLLILIGKACDMTDFFILFQEKRVSESSIFSYFILSMWTISVFQFPLVLTETRTDRQLTICMGTDIWSICVSLMMQELPFLVCRSYAIGALGLVKWYNKAEVTDPETAATVFKFKGDNLFFWKNYSEASECYRHGLDNLPESNRCMRQDLRESLTRCYMYMNKTAEALQLAHTLVEKASNTDTSLQALTLLQQIQHHFQDYNGEEDTLKQLLVLHPFNVQLWMKLAQCYHLLYSQLCPLPCGSREHVKILTCLVRARLLIRSVRFSVGSFIKEKYQKLLEKVSYMYIHISTISASQS